ncbi:MAG: TonB-dependent receptor domain-containing protein [Methylophilaceae bacterium]
MNKSIISSLIGLSLTTTIYAAENIELDDLVVTAARVPQPRESVIADITVIDREEIERAGQSSLIELLQSQPGIQVSSNGGAGQTTSVFLRGTNPGQVVVLIDGMRISSATAGTTAFENIPVAQIDRIEILRGPTTSLYGQDAIGGVIQIFTKRSEGSPQLSASAGYGSYNTKIAAVGLNGRLRDTSFSVNISSVDTDGFSAYKTQNPQFSDDDAYRNFAFSGALKQQLAQGHDIGIQLYQSKGSSQFDSRSNTTDFSDYVKLLQFSFALVSHNQFTSNWLSTLRLGESYDDYKSFQEFGDSRFKTKQRQYAWQNDVTLPLGTLTVLFDRLEQRLKSSTQFDKTSRDTDGIMLGYLVNVGNHSLQTNVRDDHSGQFGSHATGGLAYGYNLNENWRVTGSYGTAFKAPTFNDLYYPSTPGFPPASNPNLKPEESKSFEASLRYEDKTSSASITGFHNKIKNLIQLDSNFTPFNSSNALIKGVTLAGAHQIDHWQVKGNIDIQSPKDEATGHLLARRAEHFANLNIAYEWNDWRFGTEITASGKRFDNSDNVKKLSGYALVNFTTDYKINQEWKLQARANNILDKDYALAYDGNFAYQTPGANVFFSIIFSPDR